MSSVLGLRRSFACYLLAKGVRLKVVSQLLGHKTTQITEKHYAKLVNISLDEGMDIFDSKAKDQSFPSPELLIREIKILISENHNLKIGVNLKEILRNHSNPDNPYSSSSPEIVIA